MKQLPWILCAAALALVAWLALAVVNVENQRNALASKACAETDTQCLAAASTRAHWWQHLAHAMTHVRS
ncbi:hypothetical protein [Janthinobacterium sp. PC23-8]|uniref:hypothetical protein n=1 Tax=Janthinobacterium sp. PC23-8 TaxID=2012679 RepID=UPI000B95E29C|nr:hypothetical protein [Janthinobacterium sp. PC23-8]OYO26393.1 hypothetical protein CD932_24455 [Janthinobacterium sp. PC23-8]